MLDQPFDDGQPKPRALVFRGKKRDKSAFRRLGGHPHSGVPNRDADGLGVHIDKTFDRDGSAPVHCLRGILDQIGKHPLELIGVCFNGGQGLQVYRLNLDSTRPQLRVEQRQH